MCGKSVSINDSVASLQDTRKCGFREGPQYRDFECTFSAAGVVCGVIHVALFFLVAGDLNVCTEIHFIRHAESSMNAKPELICGRSPSAMLTGLGKRQARALGVHLRSVGMDFDAVYSSPLERAKQTAYAVCQVINA